MSSILLANKKRPEILRSRVLASVTKIDAHAKPCIFNGLRRFLRQIFLVFAQQQLCQFWIGCDQNRYRLVSQLTPDREPPRLQYAGLGQSPSFCQKFIEAQFHVHSLTYRAELGKTSLSVQMLNVYLCRFR